MSFKESFKKFRQDKKENIQFVIDLVTYSFIYGIIINYMLWGIFGIKFGIFTFPAYGVLLYLIQNELPIIWSKFIISKR